MKKAEYTEAVIQSLTNVEGNNRKGKRLRMEIDFKISNIGHINKKIYINQKVFDGLMKTSIKLAL